MDGPIDWKIGDELTKNCVHAEPQAPSCLHGVCIFCWRDRAGLLYRVVREERAHIAEKAKEWARGASTDREEDLLRRFAAAVIEED